MSSNTGKDNRFHWAVERFGTDEYLEIRCDSGHASKHVIPPFLYYIFLS